MELSEVEGVVGRLYLTVVELTKQNTELNQILNNLAATENSVQMEESSE